jgi:ComF family protein
MTLRVKKMQLKNDFLQFFFPELCVACRQILNKQEKVLCTHCFLHIPRTGFHKNADNPVSQLFWGRVKIEYAASFFYFNKGSAYQPLIHKLKYGGRSDVGIELGKAFGAELRESVFALADIIIPVPLHPKKLKIRGYNQSEMIAKGLSLTLNIPVNTKSLFRAESTETQTRKSRFERFRNVEGKFLTGGANELEGKHIILADDVVTTGSTLEACAIAILEIKETKVSILTLAVA